MCYWCYCYSNAGLKLETKRTQVGFLGCCRMVEVQLSDVNSNTLLLLMLHYFTAQALFMSFEQNFYFALFW